jgi:hypothetical protein
LTFAAALEAAETAAPAEPATKSAPATRTGRTIDIAQVQARADQAFGAADQDGDGKISREEFANSKLPGARQRMGEP